MNIYCYGSTPDKLITKHLNPIIRALELPAPTWLSRLELTSALQGSVLIVFGKDGFKQLTSLIPSFGFKSISSAVGERIELNGITIMVSHDPEILESDYEYWTEIYWIFASIARYMSTDSYEYHGGTCTLVKTFDADITAIKEKHKLSGKKIAVAIDIESMGTIAYNCGVRIISVAVTHEDGYASVRYFTEADMDPYLDDLRWLLTSPIIYGIGANFKFDSQWFAAKFGIETKNHEFDIVLAGSVLDEIRSNSLKTLAKLETDMGGYEDAFVAKYDMAHMELVPVDEVVTYCGLDTIATLRVAKAILPKLREKQKLYNLYNKIVHPSSIAYEVIERRGVVIDRDRFSQLDAEFSERLVQINKEALALMPRRLAFKHKDAFSLKASVVADFLFSRAGLNITPRHMTESGKAASTSKEHLEEYIAVEEARPFITLFNEFVKVQKCLGTYVHGFLDHVRPDNMFHPNYLLFKGESDDSFGGTSTGRSSCKSPAFQTIPKRGDLAKKLRSAYIAPPGYQIASLDYDQGELRVTACVADEPKMIEIYRNNGDLHKTTGMAVKKIDEAAFQALTDAERSKLRDSGKASNFGIIYDISAEGYCNFARKSYGVIIELEEGQGNIDAFFGKFTRLRPWHELYREHARKHGFTESPLGRRKNLPLVNSIVPYVRGRELRRAINNPIQGCLNDLMLYTMARVYQQRPDIWAFGTIHDQGLFYVREETAMEDALFIKDIMENLPLEKEFGWSPQVQFTAELKMGYVLSDLKKIKAI